MTAQFEALQAGQGQDDAVEIRFARRAHGTVLPHALAEDPRQAGGHIAPHGHDLQVGARGQQLCGAPRRTRSDACSGCQLRQTAAVGAAHGAQGVARVLPRRHRGDAQPGHRSRGQVFQGMNRQVAVAVEQRLAQRRRECPNAAELRQGGRVRVAQGADLNDLDGEVEAEFGRSLRDHVGDES